MTELFDLPTLKIVDANKQLEGEVGYELSPFRTLYTRDDGQVFGISHTGYGEYQSVVPADLADAGEGYQHMTEKDAESYLWELIYKVIDVDKRFVDAISDADDAFWAVIAKSYPEINSGDLEPGIVIQLKMIMETALAAWLKANAPQGTALESLVHSDFISDNVDADAILEGIDSKIKEVS